MVDDWASFLSEPGDENQLSKLRQHERTGRPLGNEEFVLELEKELGRDLRPKPPGRLKKTGR